MPFPFHWDLELASGEVTTTDGRVSLSGWLARLEPGAREAFQASIARFAAGSQVRDELRYRLVHDGRAVEVRDAMVLVEHQGTPHRIVGSVVALEASGDASAPNLVSRLELSERRFEAIIEGMPVLAWECDADGWIDYYNQRWYAYTGTDHAQMEGWGWVRVHDPLDLPRMLRLFRRALTTGEPWEDEFRLRRADGQMRWHLSRALPLKDAQGRVVRWFGTNTDVHERRLAIEEREQLYAREQELRRAAEATSREKDEFLAVLSHELRTPLSAILTRVQLIQRKPPADVAQALTTFEKVERSARQLAALIDDLLDVSRIISGKLTIDRVPVDLAEVARRAADALRPQAEAAHLSFEILASGSTVVMGAWARLEQIVTNLLTNAIKFAPNTGRVEISITGDEKRVRLSVRDTGQGIDPALLPKLFRRFQQADASVRRQHGGLGLGLSIVKHLVELHGGTVQLESAGPGLGTTVWFELPVGTHAPLPAPARPVESRAPVSLSGIRVLGVDDDAESREVLAMALLSYGATVSVVGSAAAALTALRSEVPDVIVSDIAMPDVDGFGLLARLRSSSQPALHTVPVIGLSAHASESDRSAALEKGFASYLSKPYDAGSLARLIAEIVARRVGAQPS